jgi:hypothetical protein
LPKAYTASQETLNVCSDSIALLIEHSIAPLYSDFHLVASPLPGGI